MRVIYISCIPLTSRIANDWYINYLLESGVEVEYWDIARLIRGQVIEHYQLDGSYVRIFDSYDEFESALFVESGSVFVLLLFKIWKFRRVYKILVAAKVKTVMISWGFLPSDTEKVKNIFINFLSNPKIIFTKIVNRICGLILRLRQFNVINEIVFAAGNVAMSKASKQSKVVPIALCDFDRYKQSKEIGSYTPDNKYAVYLDAYLPYQSDLPLLGMKALNPQKYYNDLNKFFYLIEAKFGFEVVIAAHPKALYTENQFFGRSVIYSKTPELIKDASLVIAHASTAISYAVLNSKPILFVYTDEMLEYYENGYMQFIYAMADYLLAPVVNVTTDSMAITESILNFSADRYGSYINDFIVTDSAKYMLSREVFLKEISLLIENELLS